MGRVASSAGVREKVVSVRLSEAEVLELDLKSQRRGLAPSVYFRTLMKEDRDDLS